MNFKGYSTQGIVLSRRNYHEADRIIKIFTKDFGKVVVLAKGVRHLKSRKRGSIEVFSRIRFSAIHTKTFDIITETIPEDLYLNIRKNLKKMSLAYYFIEIIEKITSENEKHEALYDLLVNFLERLKNESKLKKLRLEFIRKTLVNLGFWPLGKELTNADGVLEDVLERKINSVRVGKAILG